MAVRGLCPNYWRSQWPSSLPTLITPPVLISWAGVVQAGWASNMKISQNASGSPRLFSRDVCDAPTCHAAAQFTCFIAGSHAMPQSSYTGSYTAIHSVHTDLNAAISVADYTLLLCRCTDVQKIAANCTLHSGQWRGNGEVCVTEKVIEKGNAMHDRERAGPTARIAMQLVPYFCCEV